MPHVPNAPKKRKPLSTDPLVAALLALSKRDADDLCRIRKRMGDEVLLRILAANLRFMVLPPLAPRVGAAPADLPFPAPTPGDARRVAQRAYLNTMRHRLGDGLVIALFERLLEAADTDVLEHALDLGLIPEAPADAGRKAA